MKENERGRGRDEADQLWLPPHCIYHDSNPAPGAEMTIHEGLDWGMQGIDVVNSLEQRAACAAPIRLATVICRIPYPPTAVSLVRLLPEINIRP